MTDFEPWEIPTGGEPPPIHLTSDEQPDGSRLVFNRSAWMLLVQRADGRTEPVARRGAVALAPGDSLLCPKSELVESAWMLLVQRADGRTEAVARGAAALAPGDSLLCPKSELVEIDPKVIFRTQLECIRDYTLANARPFDEDETSVPSFDRGVRERWWWYRRELEHGRVLHLHPTGSNAQLTVGIRDTLIFEGQWCYPNHTDAWRAALGWNGWQDPPDGWTRHLQTARRRKDGTPESEYWQKAEAPPGMAARRR